MNGPTKGFLVGQELIVPEIGFFGFQKVETQPDPWAQAIAELLLPMPNLQDSEGTRSWVLQVLVLDWLVKLKWDSTRKPIFGRKGKNLRPIAELWKTVIDLCLELHPYVREEYPSAAEWFGALFAELELAGLSTNHGKAADLKHFKQENSALRNYGNPFQQPKTTRFISLACDRAERSDVFRKERFNPFLKARSSLTKLYSSPEMSALREIDGVLYFNRSHIKGRLEKL